jgi:integrase
MARACTGSLFENPPGSGRWHGKFTTPVGRRSIHLVTCHTREEAEARKQFIVEQLRRLREANRLEFVRKLLELASLAPTERLDRVRRGVDAIVAGDYESQHASSESLDTGPTFQEFAEEWTNGKLRQRFRDHVPEKRSVSDDIYRLKAHIYPLVGSVPLRHFTMQHAEIVMASLSDKLSAASRRHVAQLLVRVLKLAVYPARVIERSPLPVGFLPKPGSGRALAWLYPEEDAGLLAKRSIGLVYRLFYGFLDREGLRKTEGALLTWADLDLERGVITLDENKTDDARAWVLDPGVVRALKWWKEKQGGKAEQPMRVFSVDGDGIGARQLAAAFRGHLANVDGIRPVLFQSTATRMPIRVHDLRATFVTLSLASGKTETWVADRTGHKSSVMINRYRRAARTAAELNLGVLAPLDEAIPEIRESVHESSTPGPGGRETPRARQQITARRGRSRPVAAQRAPLGSGTARCVGSTPSSCTETPLGLQCTRTSSGLRFGLRPQLSAQVPPLGLRPM